MHRVVGAALFIVGSFAAGASRADTVANEAAKGACATGGVVGLSDQLVKAQMCITPGLFVPFVPHASVSLASSSVKPYLLASARDALWKAAGSLALDVTSAFRTIADQYVLYYSGACGLAAKPGNSNHETGRAVDLSNWSAATTAMEAAGCTHTYPSSDPVHFDCPGIDARADSVKAFQMLWNVNNPGDKIPEDGAYGPATESRLAKSPAGGFATPVDCTTPAMPPPLSAEFVGQGSDAPADPAGKSHFRVCAGASFKFWFELRNVGERSWVDVGDPKPDAFGRAVRLGVPGDKIDVFTGTKRVSLTEATNTDVHSTKATPAGGNCNDKATCSRTIFAKGGGIVGKAPATPGVHKTTWQLVDEGRAWFGPQMFLTFDVVACPTGDAGSTDGEAGAAPDDAAIDDAALGADAGDGSLDGAANDANGGDLAGCACVVGPRSGPPALCWALAALGLALLRRSRAEGRGGS